MGAITPVKMPKWGLSMQEGMVVRWCKAEGEAVAEGEELVDIETSKITNAAESPTAGVLRRVIAQPEETLPVGALLAVLSDATTADAEIDAFVADFQANFIPEVDDEAGEQGLRLGMVEALGETLRVGTKLGEGAPLVLLHGFAGDMNGWLFNIDALGAGRSVIAIDLPGHGGSAKDVGDGSLARMAKAVDAALTALDAGAAHFVGHSLGAAVAAQLALDHPQRLKSLTLIAPAGLPGGMLSADFLNDVVEAQRPRDLRPALERLVADPALVSRDMVEEVIRFKRLDGAEEALAALRDRMLAGEDFAGLQARLGELPPALVVAGREDAIVGAPDPARLPAGWRVAWIEGAGHMPHLEKAGEVNALISAWIAAKENT
jgi:pyruvate dehydrogenase E2 component (dihydrolipoamide acetyltransferase)